MDAITPTATTPPGPTARPPALRAIFNNTMLLDVVAPIAIYQLLIHGAGMARVPALVLSGAVPAVHVVQGIVRTHKLDVIGTIVLVSIAVGALVAGISGDAKLVLLRDSFTSVAVGIAFLISALVGRPFLFLIIRTFASRSDAAQEEVWNQRWETEPGFRRVMRQMTVAWSAAFAAEFALKVLMVETLSIDLVQALSSPVIFAVTAGMIVLTMQWGKRAAAKGEARRAAGTAPATG